MDNNKPSYINAAVKWGLIYTVTSIVITYLIQLSNLGPTSPVKYLNYVAFIAFLVLAQKEYKNQLGGFLTFGEGFMSGFIYSVVAGVLGAVFIYIYLAILNPHFLEQTIAAQHEQYVAQGLSEEQIDQATEMGKKLGPMFGALGVLFLTPIMGAVVALIGAAILKKEKPATELEQEISHTEPNA